MRDTEPQNKERPSSASLATERALVNATDLRQFAYCPRIVFFQSVLGIKPPPTFPMEQGTREQIAYDDRQKRHRLARIGLADARRHLRLTMRSERLGLVGKVDLLLEGATRVAPVEVKFSERPPGPGYILQLVAYALLAEEHFQKPSPAGFFYYLPSKKWLEVQISETRRRQCVAAIHAVRQILQCPDLPQATPRRERCPPCEYLRFCGDRW